jgi:5-methylthioadenosine/S-adenosylhomocysteine deaminase
MMDIVIHNGLVVTMNSEFAIFENGAVAIRDGLIEKVWTPDPNELLPEAKEIFNAQKGLVLPGFVNCHTHLPMSLFRGLADDLPLEKWLNEHIFPAEAKHITAQTVRLGTRLSCAEMLLSGTTTCCDGYFLSQRIAETVKDIGLRAVLGQGVIDFPAPGVPDPTHNIEHAKDFIRAQLGKSPLITPSIFCHSPYTCSPNTLIKAKQTASDLGVLFQIHVAETRFERDQCQREHGKTPIDYLLSLGVLDENTLLIHAVWVDSEDIRKISKSGAKIIHCPESNMKLASGIAPVPDFLAAGIPVGLGTDGCASNNDLDMFREMDTCAKLSKVDRLDPTILDAMTVLRMATIDGARVLGMEKNIGSIEPGKQADIIVLDSAAPHLCPLYQPVSHIVYSAGGSDVRHVMVNGQWLVRDRRILTLDLGDLLEQVSMFVKTIEV